MVWKGMIITSFLEYLCMEWRTCSPNKNQEDKETRTNFRGKWWWLRTFSEILIEEDFNRTVSKEYCKEFNVGRNFLTKKWQQGNVIQWKISISKEDEHEAWVHAASKYPGGLKKNCLDLYTQLEVASRMVLYCWNIVDAVKIENMLLHRRPHITHGWENIGEAEE